MTTQSKHRELAVRIRDAYAGTAIGPVRAELADLDVDAAYAIQQENTAHWQAEGRRLVGSKIGLTSHAVQRQLGVECAPRPRYLGHRLATPDGWKPRQRRSRQSAA
jgi:2-keto-4-pentenoate hydratase